MPYTDRPCFDAYARVMVPKDWLNEYADPAIRVSEEVKDRFYARDFLDLLPNIGAQVG